MDFSVFNCCRSHHQFIDDVTDAYIIGAFLDVFDMGDMDSKPTKRPVFSLMTDKEIIDWTTKAAVSVVESLQLSKFDKFAELASDIQAMDQDQIDVNAMYNGDRYECALCGNQYTQEGWFRKHLKKKHRWKFHSPNEKTSTDNPVRCFLFMSLLLRDTHDSYRMGDGDRIIRNSYFEWLYASALGHTKYKIWLFRMISYVSGLLTRKQAYEYKWNMTVNLEGGTGHNIPNDNCVEIQVHKLKSQLQSQGSNKSFESARNICLSTQVIEGIQEQLMKTTRTYKTKRSRPPVDKTKDIQTIVELIRKTGPVKDLSWATFGKFKDPIACIDANKLHGWISHQKVVANEYLSE